MPYPGDYTGVQIRRETHQRIANLKEGDETFDSVVNRLLDLEEKYADNTEEYEYSYLSKVFKVVFSDKVDILYFNPRTNGFEKDISVWQSVDALSEEELDSFVKFIVKDSSLWLLYDMESELQLNDIHIRRV